MSPYDPDSQFSKSALSRLEAAGIPVLTSLKGMGVKKIADSIGVDCPSYWCNILDEWASGKISGNRPPTWRSLYGVMREHDLKKLSQEIEEYLSCEWVNIYIIMSLHTAL